MVLLSTAYFPPLSWFALAARDMTLSPDRVFPSVAALEACENYQKQSYRNRCYILASDGPQMLQVPVVHGGDHSSKRECDLSSTSLRDHRVLRESSISGMAPLRANVPERFHSPSGILSVRVDYSTPWIVRTERALDTAYETSAYYEYYRDSLFPLLEARSQTLWELNLSLIRWCLDRCRIACELVPTSAYSAPDSQADDYRYVIHPKRPDTVLADLGLEHPYYQVFRDRLGGFTPRLSILDLLFNEGPDSILWLTRAASPCNL